ncbi:hypothetical protein BsWGS_12084 [Bradybaena similaris]
MLLQIEVTLFAVLWIGADGNCLHKGVTYPVGPFKSQDPCELNCQCTAHGGRAFCTAVYCDTVSCPEGEVSMPQPGKCCSQCTPVILRQYA